MVDIEGFEVVNQQNIGNIKITKGVHEMTTHTHTRLVCPCGHKGSIVESENDQPYSKEWHSTSLRDLESKGTYKGSNVLFAEERPSCPKCGMTLTPDHIVK